MELQQHKKSAVKGQINSSESTASHPNYGLNRLTNPQLVKPGEYTYIPEDIVNMVEILSTGMRKPWI